MDPSARHSHVDSDGHRIEVQLADGDVLTTDGPFTEGKEHIGGFQGRLEPATQRRPADPGLRAFVFTFGP